MRAVAKKVTSLARRWGDLRALSWPVAGKFEVGAISSRGYEIRDLSAVTRQTENSSRTVICVTLLIWIDWKKSQQHRVEKVRQVKLTLVQPRGFDASDM